MPGAQLRSRRRCWSSAGERLGCSSPRSSTLFGSEVQLFQAGPGILPTEDEDVSAAVAAAFRRAGIVVRESFGAIESFEKTPNGVRMNFAKDDRRENAEAAL